jgi:nitrate/nitrite-specific signal transduction histidine kinase
MGWLNIVLTLVQTVSIMERNTKTNREKALEARVRELEQALQGAYEMLRERTQTLK